MSVDERVIAVSKIRSAFGKSWKEYRRFVNDKIEEDGYLSGGPTLNALALEALDLKEAQLREQMEEGLAVLTEGNNDK